MTCLVNGSILLTNQFVGATSTGDSKNVQTNVLRGEAGAGDDPRRPRRIHGGGAENRTPVQSGSLAGVSRLSHHLRFGHVTRGDPRLVP